MKNLVICGIFILVIGLLAPQITTAQGTVTFLSNLGQTPSGSNPVGSDSWLAAGFQTGNNASGYAFNSVQLDMTDAPGSPNGFTVKLYSTLGVAALPGSSLSTLAGSADPNTTGTYTYNSVSSVTLSATTTYFIVITASTSIANGAYEWSYSAADNYNPNGGWFAAGSVQSSNGSLWNIPTSGYLQFAINATPTPEPGVIGLFALGGLLIGFQRRKQRPV